ncbi:MAG: gephyrin-like molybdotransferase Glp [bacterium]
MVEPDHAWRVIVASVMPLPAAPRTYSQCLYHYLAEPVLADRDIPAADRSAMDGYAVRADDIAATPVNLRVVGEIPAGSAAQTALAPGDCVRIFTGANVPPDADTVVMVEDTESKDDGVVTILAPVSRGRNILRRGENARRGVTLLPRGAALDATALAVCAAAGCVEPRVHARPRIAVITTGAELKQPGEKVDIHEIRDSNGPMLVAALAEHGFDSTAWVCVPDDRAKLLAALCQALRGNDVVLVTGGVSVGKYDLVPDVVREAGGTIRFHGVAMKPGKPQLFASADGNRCIFGLPGNPLSVLTGFHEFVLPALRYLSGCPEADCRRRLRLPLFSPVATKGRVQHYLLGRLVHTDSGTTVEPIPNAGSADLEAGSKAEGMIVMPAAVSSLPAGALVDYHAWRRL